MWIHFDFLRFFIERRCGWHSWDHDRCAKCKDWCTGPCLGHKWSVNTSFYSKFLFFFKNHALVRRTCDLQVLISGALVEFLDLFAIIAKVFGVWLLGLKFVNFLYHILENKSSALGKLNINHRDASHAWHAQALATRTRFEMKSFNCHRVNGGADRSNEDAMRWFEKTQRIRIRWHCGCVPFVSTAVGWAL